MDKSKQLWRKRARLHFSEKKQSQTRRDRTACVASLFKYVFCFPTEPNFIRPCARSLTTASAKHKPEEMPYTHTNTYANSITSSSELPCAHMLLQASILTHTHSLECSKEIRAAGQGGVRPASSANPLFLHLSRSPGIITHILDIAMQFPPWREKRKGCLLLYAVGIFKWTPARSNCGTLWPGGEFRYRQTPV